MLPCANVNIGSTSTISEVFTVPRFSYLKEQSRLNFKASFTAAVIVQLFTLHPITSLAKSVVPNSKLNFVLKLGGLSFSAYVCLNAPEVPASVFAPKTPRSQ